jgi:hypothetical protein
MKVKIAFLDTCVLYPLSLRDIFMQFAFDGLFQAKWSSLVEAQLVKNIEDKYPQHKGKIANTVRLMRIAIPDFKAEDSLEIIEAVTASSTDKGDIEILAAAIANNCTHLVTFNLKDFDIGFAAARAVSVIHPDEFLYELISESPDLSRQSFEIMVKRTKTPPRSYLEYCQGIKRNNMAKTAKLLESFLDN